MGDLLVIRVRLFGAFRNLSSSNEVELKLLKKMTVREIKVELETIFKSSDVNFDVRKLLSRSVMADQVRILADSDIIENEVCLSILPPVCGG